MGKQYKVWVDEDYRWNEARVAGREFTKQAPVTLSEREMTDEIRGSELLDIVEVTPDVVATVAAMALAEEAAIDLTLMVVAGSGADGKIIKSDVQRFIRDRSQESDAGAEAESDGPGRD